MKKMKVKILKNKKINGAVLAPFPALNWVWEQGKETKVTDRARDTNSNPDPAVAIPTVSYNRNMCSTSVLY